MDINTAMMTRRTIHLWKDLPVEESAIVSALEAAQMAPCHKFTWPWRFTRVGASARSAIYNLTAELKKGNSDALSERVKQLLVRKIKNPGELVVVSLVRCEDAFTDRENYAAASCAIHNMSLSLHANGYGSKWSTGKVTRHPESYTILNIDPKQEEIIGFIWIGVPDVVPATPERPLLSAVVRRVD